MRRPISCDTEAMCVSAVAHALWHTHVQLHGVSAKATTQPQDSQCTGNGLNFCINTAKLTTSNSEVTDHASGRVTAAHANGVLPDTHADTCIATQTTMEMQHSVSQKHIEHRQDPVGAKI